MFQDNLHTDLPLLTTLVQFLMSYHFRMVSFRTKAKFQYFSEVTDSLGTFDFLIYFQIGMQNISNPAVTDFSLHLARHSCLSLCLFRPSLVLAEDSWQ